MIVRDAAPGKMANNRKGSVFWSKNACDRRYNLEEIPTASSRMFDVLKSR